MKGNIYSDQKCPQCSGRFVHYERRGGLFCKEHPKIAATGKFIVVFGRGVRKRVGNYDEAARILNGMRYETDLGKFDEREYAAGRPLAAENALKTWIEEKKRTVADGTMKSYRSGIKRFIEFLGPTSLKAVNRPLLRKYIYWCLDDLGLAGKTVDNDLNTLRCCYNDLTKDELLMQKDIPPFPEVPHYEMRLRNLIDLETQADILDRIRENHKDDPKVWVAIRMLCRYPSIRPNEIRGIKEGDIFYERGEVFIRIAKERRHKDKFVPLFSDDLELLRSFPRGMPDLPFFRHAAGLRGIKPGQPFGNKCLYRAWKRACDELGVENVDLYGGTKHTTMTAVSRRTSPEAAKKASGLSGKVLERYIHEDNESRLTILSVRDQAIDEARAAAGKSGAGGKQVVNIKEARKSAK